LERAPVKKMNHDGPGETLSKPLLSLTAVYIISTPEFPVFRMVIEFTCSRLLSLMLVVAHPEFEIAVI